jgi:cyclic-di-GMP phosphodiesterase TipF (flagellum assembly factor)
MRLGAAFIALCMVLIAASLGAILYLSAGFSGTEASVVAIAILTALMIYNSATTRSRDQNVVSRQIADLSRGTADLARQVGDIGRRIEAAEVAAGAAPERARAATAPLAAELATMSNLIKELAESVAAHEDALAHATFASQNAPPPAVPALDPLAGDSAAAIDLRDLDEPEPARLASGRFRGMERSRVVAMLAAAIEANRVDLYLQPIVTLPQRKVRFYEAVARLRTEDGEVLIAADFQPFAEAGGLMPRIDNLILFRCVQVVRRLAGKNRDIGVFCGISASTLSDPKFFPQISDFMQANRALAPSLVLEFAQATMRDMGPIEHESLAALADLGFRFSLDRLTDLRIEPRELADRSFRFKAPAVLLLNRASAQGADIHPADLSDLLGRFGIDLIADQVDGEGTVVDLLDYDVRFGQGLLFSPPRPVRTEALELGDRSDAPRHDTPRHEAQRREAPTLPSAATLRSSARDNAPPMQPEPTAETRPGRRAGMLAQLARGVVCRA